jgi:epoxyqueuosine reductase
VNAPAVERSRRVLGMCRELGFALAGVCRPDPSRWGVELRAWLDAGRHGDMAFLSDELDKRIDVSRLLAEVAPEGPPARAVVMVADRYAPREGGNEPPTPGAGRIARYARGRDYHGIIKKRLHRLADTLRAEFPGTEYRSFVDTAPVLERELAVRAGLGWQAKNTMLIHNRAGSWLLLGGVVTNLNLEEPPEQEPTEDHCGTCTRCIDACPTGAITPYAVDAARCVSYLTIEHRGEIDPALEAGVRDWVYGCDVCQEVCPHNSPRERPEEVSTPYQPRRVSLDVLDVLGWGEAERRAAFSVSAMKRARLDMVKRNAIIVLANQALGPAADPGFRSAALTRIWRASEDASETELVRRTASRALRRLGGSSPATAAPPPPRG